MAGINIRHLGLIRSLLWKDLPCLVSVYHHQSIVRTQQDMREEVSNGQKIRIFNEIFLIEENKKQKITHECIPISGIYLGESINGISASIGKISDIFDNQRKVSNSKDLRVIFLGEVVKYLNQILSLLLFYH
jgi:hypothetical protein